MKPGMIAALLACLFFGVLVGWTARSRVAFAVTDSATPDALRQLEAEFMKAAAERGSAGYLSYYADDAVELPNGSYMLQGKPRIAKTMGFLDSKGNQLTWSPVYADMAASGDLGYTYGTFQFQSKDKDGKVSVSYGKYTSIWKKQKSGNWKVVLDMGNDSPGHETP